MFFRSVLLRWLVFFVKYKSCVTSRLPTRLNPFQKRKKQEIRTAVVRISCRWRRKRIRLIAERASLLAKAKRQPRGRGFGGVAACNRRLHKNPSYIVHKSKRTSIFACPFCLAEMEGFEPSIPCGKHDFQSCAIDRLGDISTQLL